jgi:type IX secretion system PorP/SprF family membrane protein
LSYLSVLSQDHSFPLQYVTPSLINPAFGGMTEGLARFGVGHRIRRATESETFNTTHFTADWSWRGLRYGEPDMLGGMSAVVISDIAGGLRTTQVIGTACYEMPLGIKVRYNQLRGGIQVGMNQRTLIEPALVFEDQFNGQNFNRPSQESFANTSQTVLDVSAGLLWYSTQNVPGNREINHYLGFSVHHINRPSTGFFQAERERASIRYTTVGGVKFRPGNMLLDNRLDFNANAIYSVQNNSRFLSLNFFAKLTFFDKGRYGGKEKAGIFAGATVRRLESFVSYVGFDLARKLSFAFAYDLLSAKNRILPSSYGGVQFFVTYLVSPVLFDLAGYSQRDSSLPFPHF